jgi:hypothetical protein
MKASGQLQAPAGFSNEVTALISFVNKLDGPQSRSDEEISPLPGIESFPLNPVSGHFIDSASQC